MELKINNRLIVTLVGILVVSALWLVPVTDSKAKSVPGLSKLPVISSQQKKARYYYNAGIVEQSRENEAQAYEYFKKAYQMDPTYEEAAAAYGSRRLAIEMDTLQSEEELNRSLGMLRQYIDAYPEDLYESQVYGYVAAQLGHTDESVRVLERAYGYHPSTTGILMQLSEVYGRAGEIEKAIDAIDRYESAEGLQPQVTTRKLSYLLSAKDTLGAIREVSRLVDVDPLSSSYRILKGNVFDIINQPDSAYAYYKQAEMLDPESGAAKLALAGYYEQTGDSVAYDNKMYEVLLTEELDLDHKIELISQYLVSLLRGNGDTQRGDHLFSVLSSQYPHEPRVLDLAARYSAAKHDFEDAEEQIAYAIDLDPTNVTYWGQLMTYQAADDRPEESLATYERAEEHITPDTNLKFFYASVAQQAERYDLAREMYNSMIYEIQSDLPVDSLLTLRDVRTDITSADLDMLSRLFTQLGDIAHLEGCKDESYRAYENAITFDPSNTYAYNNYAYFMALDGGDLTKALQLSEKSLSGSDFENPTFIDTYAWICYLSGDYEKAEEMQRKAIGISENESTASPELYDHFGDILAATGKWNEAAQAWRKAIEELEKRENKENEIYVSAQKKLRDAEEKGLVDHSTVENQPAVKNGGVAETDKN